MKIEIEAYWKRYRASMIEHYKGEEHLETFLSEMYMAFKWTEQNLQVTPLIVDDAGVCLMHTKESKECTFGFMTFSKEHQTNQRLWQEARAHAKEIGASSLKGPIQGTTYFPYRFVIETDGSPFFKGEYFSRPDDHAFMMEQEPKAVHYYRSGYRNYFDGIMQVSKPYYDRALEEGLTMRLHRSVDRSLFHDLAQLIDRIFGGNWSFQSLSPEALEQIFQQEFGSEQKMALHTFWHEGEMIGFCRYIQNDKDTVICKTLGLLPEYQKRGWGNASVYQMHADAKANDVKRMIYALIFDGNRVQQNMPKDDSVIFRRYASYSFALR